MVSWVLYVKFRIEKHCLVKDFAFLKNVCYLLKVPIIFWKTFCASGAVIVFVFYELMIDPQPTFLGPGYSSRIVNNFLIKGKTIKKNSHSKKIPSMRTASLLGFFDLGPP